MACGVTDRKCGAHDGTGSPADIATWSVCAPVAPVVACSRSWQRCCHTNVSLDRSRRFFVEPWIIPEPQACRVVRSCPPNTRRLLSHQTFYEALLLTPDITRAQCGSGARDYTIVASSAAVLPRVGFTSNLRIPSRPPGTRTSTSFAERDRVTNKRLYVDRGPVLPCVHRVAVAGQLTHC